MNLWKKTIQLPEDIFKDYNRLFKANNGIAIVTVKRDICQGCLVKLPVGDIDKMKNSSLPVLCSSGKHFLTEWTLRAVGFFTNNKLSRDSDTANIDFKKLIKKYCHEHNHKLSKIFSPNSDFVWIYYVLLHKEKWRHQIKNF